MNDSALGILTAHDAMLLDKCVELVEQMEARQRVLTKQNRIFRATLKEIAAEDCSYGAHEPENNRATFDTEDTWFIEHSLDCRIAGTIGTCEFNHAIKDLTEEQYELTPGRWRITGIDEMGLPSLERADA